LKVFFFNIRNSFLFNTKEIGYKQMEQSPAVPFSFHVRMVLLMKVLVAMDLILASYAINITMQNGPNMMIMFAFEVRIINII